MSIKNFIQENKSEIDIAILRALGCWIQGTDTCSCDKKHLNNSERELWLRNDESLYRFARMYHVNI
jgi:hypothetical protein